MAEKDDPKQASKKISITDTSEATPGSAPELTGTPEPDVPERPESTKLAASDDTETDEAVEDIMKQDGDEVLKVQDEKAQKAVVMKTSMWERFKNAQSDWWSSPGKRWGTIGVVLIAVGALFAVPYTRYNIVGVVLKAPVTVTVVDSKTGAPVTGATVQVGSRTAESDAHGKAVLTVHAGSRHLQVSKKYYQGYSGRNLVALSGNNFKASLVALGHQVNVKVVNKVTGKPVANAVLAVQGGNTKTDAKGLATVVIASGATTQEAKLTLAGYNAATVNISASGDLAKNTFSITPAGKLYFLSNLSGRLDVVKTNLDGTDRQVVLEGTGTEDKYNTSLLASRDWKYLALLSKRTGSDNASVYLIDTTSGDKLTTIDEGNAQFSLIGWSGDRFIYKVHRNTVNDWQSNQEALKSFDPTSGHTLLLDQTQGSGPGATFYAKQSFDAPYLIGDQVVYVKGWYGQGWNALDGKQAEFDTIGADGSGHKVLKSFTPASYPLTFYFSSITVDARLYEPAGIYLQFGNNGGDAQFYTYEDGKVTSDSSMTNDKFYQDSYPTYLLSPSSNSTFWSDQRDGKNTLFVGDKDAKAPKTVASLSDYNTYGWFTDDYLLVSKSSSELYIMPASGGTPFKITDYYKPAINYNGYGGGYGGL